METNSAKKLLPRNLIAIIYTNKDCNIISTNEFISGLVIDVEKDEWLYKNPTDQTDWQPITRKIGDCDCQIRSHIGGVVGIYNLTIAEQLSLIIEHSQKMIEENSENLDKCTISMALIF